MVTIRHLFKSVLSQGIALLPYAVTASKTGNSDALVSDKPDDFVDKIVNDFMHIPASVRTRKYNKLYTIHKRFEDGKYFFELAPSMILAIGTVKSGARYCEGILIVNHHEATHESYDLFIFERVKLED